MPAAAAAEGDKDKAAEDAASSSGSSKGFVADLTASMFKSVLRLSSGTKAGSADTSAAAATADCDGAAAAKDAKAEEAPVAAADAAATEGDA